MRRKVCVAIANSRVKAPAHGRSVVWDETLRSAHDVKRSVRYRYRPQTL
nr:MAG TPA: hypothetical protein [Caudoviricetes sp.]